MLRGLIDTRSKVHDNARKYGMYECAGCCDSPALNSVALAAYLIVSPRIQKGNHGGETISGFCKQHV